MHPPTPSPPHNHAGNTRPQPVNRQRCFVSNQYTPKIIASYTQGGMVHVLNPSIKDVFGKLGVFA